MKIAIVGCRDYVNQLEFDIALNTLFKQIDIPTWIVSGGARGADSLARFWARQHEMNYTEFPAQWNTKGKSAGLIRNRKIIDECYKLIAFWDHKSKGTRHSIDLAREQKKLIGIYNIVKQEWEIEELE